MNKYISDFISNYSVRIKINNEPHGSAVIFSLSSEDYIYVFTMKHCLTVKSEGNNFYDDISIDFWDIDKNNFYETPVKVNIGSILYDTQHNEDDIVIIVLKKSILPLNLENVKDYSLCSTLPLKHENFFFRGFPVGMSNMPNNKECKLSDDNINTLKLEVSASNFETTLKDADDNTKNFSGSGIWFEYQNQFYLTAILSEFNKAIPTFNAIKFNRINEILNLYSEFKKIEIIDLEFYQSRKSLKPITNSEDPNNRFILHFRREYSNFIGREQELGQLNSFLDIDKVFFWTHITGFGGVGKSRLIYEFCNQIIQKKWQVNYIEDFQIYQNHNEIVKDTLFVIDDESLSVENIKRIILDFEPNVYNKIRLIFISRLLPSDFNDYLSTEPQLVLNAFNEGCINIEGISENEYLNLILSTLQKSNLTTDLANETLIQIQKNLDPLRRPIFALLIGLALIEKKDITNWITKDLLEYYYASEKRKVNLLISNKHVLDKHLNLVAILFIIRKPFNELIKEILELKKTWLPSFDEFDEKFLLHFLQRIPNSNYLVNLYPDIISTYFSLERFAELKKDIRYGESDITSILKFIEERALRPIKDIQGDFTVISYGDSVSKELLTNGLFVFRNLVLQDFPEHDLTMTIITANHKGNDFDDSPILSKFITSLIFNLKINDVTKMDAYEKILGHLSNDAKRQRDTVLASMNFKYYQIRRGFEVDKYYSELRIASEEYAKNPWDGNIVFIDPTNTLPIYEHIEYVQNIRTTSKNGEKIRWAAIPYIESISIEAIILNNYEANITHTELLNRLAYLCQEWTDPRMRFCYLKVITKSNLLPHHQVLSKIDTTLKELLKTPKQISPINTNLFMVYSLFLVVEYLLIQNSLFLIEYYYNMVFKHFTNIEQNEFNKVATIELMKKTKSLFDRLYKIDRRLCNILFQYNRLISGRFQPDEEEIRPFLSPPL